MADPWKAVRELLHDAVDEVFPGAVLLVARGPDRLFLQAAGRTALPGHGVPVSPVTPGTVFDLASLTKPLATTAVLATLLAEGEVTLDHTLDRHLPGTRDTDTAGLTLRQLLAHASGLPAWHPFGADLCRTHGQAVAGTGLARERVMGTLVSSTLDNRPGNLCEYSDLGFLLLGFLVEAIRGRSLDRLFRERMSGPLGLGRTFFVPLSGREVSPPPVETGEVAATEFCPTRKRLLQAEVHDDNAWILGGVAGHAGLFGSARDVHTLCLAFLDAHAGSGSGPLDARVVRELWDRGKAPGDSTWALGFDTPTPGNSSAGTYAPGSLVGHLGFTGTSIWLDPADGTSVILLTNRVHPSRENDSIREFRPGLHDAVWEALSGI